MAEGWLKPILNPLLMPAIKNPTSDLSGWTASEALQWRTFKGVVIYAAYCGTFVVWSADAICEFH